MGIWKAGAITIAQCVALACAEVARAADPVRAFNVEVAAVVADDPAPAQRVVLFRLGCLPDVSFCHFERITLNQCTADAESERAFVPRYVPLSGDVHKVLDCPVLLRGLKR